MAGVFSSCFIAKFIIYNMQHDKSFDVLNTFNSLIKPIDTLYTLINSFRYFFLNLRQLIYDPTVEVYYSESIRYVRYSLITNANYIKDIEQLNSFLGRIIDSSQYADVELLMLGNICSRLDYFVSIEDCESFSEGLAKQGLIVLIANYINIFQDSLRDYEINNREATYYINSKALFDACNV
jgi:hypothetical protein